MKGTAKLVQRSARALRVPCLYHYRKFNAEHLVDLVQKGVVRFSNPAQFNDPWDCRPLFGTKRLNDPKVRESHIHWLQQTARRQAARERKAALDEDRLAKDADELRRTPALLRHLIEQSTVETATAIRSAYRIFCMTTEPDHLLMWSHYTASHSGLCLKFGIDHLFGEAYEVTYSSDYEYPEVDITSGDEEELVIASLLTKACIWSYENEFRAINKEGGMEGFPDCSDAFVRIPLGCLQAVIMGCQMADKERRAVEEIVGSAPRRIELKQAIMAHGRYELEIKPV